VDAYERYLADGGRKIPADRRAEVEKEIVRQKARIATLEIHGLPGEQMFAWMATEIGRGDLRACAVGVGKHTIAASAEGYDSAEKEVVVAGEDHKAVRTGAGQARGRFACAAIGNVRGVGSAHGIASCRTGATCAGGRRCRSSRARDR